MTRRPPRSTLFPYTTLSRSEHDDRTPPAELQHRLLQVPPRLLRHLAAGRIAARERHGAYPRVGDDAPHRLVLEEHRPEQPVGETRFPEDAFDLERATRHVGGVLQEPRVPRDERRRGEAKHLPEREVPRHDREHRSDRLE